MSASTITPAAIDTTPPGVIVVSPDMATDVGTPPALPTKIFADGRVASLLKAIAAALSTSAFRSKAYVGALPGEPLSKPVPAARRVGTPLAAPYSRSPMVVNTRSSSKTNLSLARSYRILHWMPARILLAVSAVPEALTMLLTPIPEILTVTAPELVLVGRKKNWDSLT